MQATPFFDALQSARWQEAVAAPLAELNLQVIEAVVAWSGHPGRAGSLAWVWRAMGPEARERAAGCRFLLLDLGLARPELWQAGAAGSWAAMCCHRRIERQPRAATAGSAASSSATGLSMPAAVKAAGCRP